MRKHVSSEITKSLLANIFKWNDNAPVSNALDLLWIWNFDPKTQLPPEVNGDKYLKYEKQKCVLDLPNLTFLYRATDVINCSFP